MGNQRKPPRKVLIKETHEPAVPINWPDGHVNVDLTGDADDECMIVTIHGVKHYIHSSTARALSNRLLQRIDEWNAEVRANPIAQALGAEEV